MMNRSLTRGTALAAALLSLGGLAAGTAQPISPTRPSQQPNAS